jgi:hypothetical protein
LGALAIDEQRTGQSHRDLRDADELLDVAGQRARVEGVAADVLEVDAGALAHERPSRV